MVKRVERLETELKVGLLREVEVLQDRCVQVVVSVRAHGTNRLRQRPVMIGIRCVGRSRNGIGFGLCGGGDGIQVIGGHRAVAWLRSGYGAGCRSRGEDLSRVDNRRGDVMMGIRLLVINGRGRLLSGAAQGQKEEKKKAIFRAIH